MQRLKTYIYCVLIALLTLSCDKDNDSLMDTQSVLPIELNAQIPDLETRALREYLPESWDDTETISTRTYAVPNPIDASNPSEYIQYWSEGDAISVFSTTENLQYVLQYFKDGQEDVGIFTLADNENQGLELTTDYFYSVYPYKTSSSINYESGEIAYNFPKTQHYNGDSYANGENGMVAREPKDDDGILYFQNFCSYLQLRIVDSNSQSIKKVKQITLTSKNTNDKMAGEAAIKYVGDAPEVAMKMGSSNQIILNCGSGVELSQDENNPSKFWFVLPGDFTFTNGFSIVVAFDDNTYFEKSTEKEIFIKRSYIKPMATFETEEEEEDIITTGPIRYKYKDTSITEPYPLNNSFYGVDGQPLKIIDQVYDEETEEWVVHLSGTLKTIGGNSFKEIEPEIEYINIQNEDTTTSIIVSDFAFYNCTAESINIYNNVESINESAFENAYTTNLFIEGDVATLKTNLGSGSYLEEIVINGKVTTIEESAFNSCMDLQTVQIESIDSIGYRAFYQCRSLSEIDLSTVKYICDGAFRNCTKLQTATLNSVITIGDNAFMGCSRLTSVVISENCTMIGEGAFCNASKLQTVTCYAVLPPFIKTDNTDGSYVFDGTPKNLKIYIPNGSMGSYTDEEYFVKNNPGYTSPIQATVNWWYQEYTGKLSIIE